MHTPRGRYETVATSWAGHHRDLGLARARRVTTTLGVGVVAAVGVLTVFVARAIPGHHAGTAAVGGTSSGATSPTSGASDGSSGAEGESSSGSASSGGSALAPAKQAPTSTTSPPSISSGAS